MTPAESQARNRYYMMMAVNLVAVAGAVFGLVLAGRSNDWGQTVLGGAIVISALYMMAVVPRAMARKWRTPPEA
jgi:membrane protein YdbS with pleckstrin-like domain